MWNAGAFPLQAKRQTISEAPAADGLVEYAMSSEIMHEIVEMIETEVQSRRTPIEFEMAYQARVAIDRIRFAIRQTDQFAPRTDQMREVGLQLLDAMERLESADRGFLKRLRVPNRLQSSHTPTKGLNGQAEKSERLGDL